MSEISFSACGPGHGAFLDCENGLSFSLIDEFKESQRRYVCLYAKGNCKPLVAINVEDGKVSVQVKTSNGSEQLIPLSRLVELIENYVLRRNCHP